MENEHQQQFLPDEICIDILSRLPGDSILQCKRVCKAWRYIIEQDHVFRAMNTRRLISSAASSSSSLDFVYLDRVKVEFFNITYYELRFIEYNAAANDEAITMCFKRSTLKLPVKQDPKTNNDLRLMIVGSCNGLICLATFSHEDDVYHHIFVYNPLACEYIDLSHTTTELTYSLVDGRRYLMKIGFGYLPSTNEYKVVRIYTHNIWRRRVAHVQVYTLGSGRTGTGTGIRWRTIPRRSWCNILFENRARARGASVNGAIYFNDFRKVISFDLANEEFRIIIPQPTCITEFIQLGVLGGCLCGMSRSAASANTYSETLDLWVMEEKNDTWIKTYSIQCGMLDSIPLGNAFISPHSMILLMQPENKNKIDSYNPGTGCIMSSMNIPGDYGYCWGDKYLCYPEIIPYVKNCVSLKALGEKYAKKGSCSSDCEEILVREEEAGCSAKGAFKKRKRNPTS